MSIRSVLTVGSGGCAAVGVITELVDVHATLSIGVITRDIPCDGGRGGFGVLLEGDSSSDLRVTSDGCNYNRGRHMVSKDMDKVVETLRAIKSSQEMCL